MSTLLALDLSTNMDKQEFAMDIRDSAINWINDIEQDSAYARWSSSLTELLRPTFPGMLRNIRRNLYNLVCTRRRKIDRNLFIIICIDTNVFQNYILF